MGERLKELRGGRTQAEFAALLGMSQAQYNRYETGRVLAPDRVLTAVAELCGLAPRQVVFGTEPPPQAAAPASSGPTEAVQAVANLLRLLDREGLEDMYYFLKRKTEDLARRRRQDVKEAVQEAQAALDELKRRAG